MYKTFIKRDLKLFARKKADYVSLITFSLIMAVFFSIGIGNIPESVSLGIMLSATILSALTIVDNFYESDFESGMLEQLVINKKIHVLVISRVIFFSLLTFIIFSGISPVFIFLFNLDSKVILGLVIINLLISHL